MSIKLNTMGVQKHYIKRWRLMTDAAFIEATIISLGVLIFLGALLGLIALLTVLRRRRLEADERLLFQATTPIVPVKELLPTPTAQETDSTVSPEKPPPSTNSIPEEFRLPVQIGSPDQVVIMIEPGTEPSRKERDIRRLIAYLKNETNAKEPAKAG